MAATFHSSVPTCVRATHRASNHTASHTIPPGTALSVPPVIHRRAPPRLTSSFWTNPANGFARRAGALKGGCASAGSRLNAARSGRKIRVAGGARAEAVDPVVQFSPDDFSVERLLGTLDFMNVSSYSMPPGSSSSTSSLSSLTWPGSREDTAAGLSERDINQLAGGGQEVGRGGVQIRMYRGRMVTPGERLGTRVLLKAYPGREAAAKAVDVDAMAANELVTHVALQEAQDATQDDEVDVSSNVLVLLGGFETGSGEKWLVMRDNGYITAADYAKAASEATAEARAVGDFEVWDRFDPAKPLFRREVFIRKLLRGFLQGLSYMHSKGRLHQSIGPASVVLNTINEMDVRYLVPRLRDFAFAIDISNPAVLSAGVGSAFDAVDEVKDSLWRRAASAGAKSFQERRSFGLADDIYAAGLLVAYMAFVPLCAPGAIDGPSLQRLLETTFSLNIPAAREYCSADDRWSNAVAFLDRRDGAGWELLQAMLNPDYRQRPSAVSAMPLPLDLPASPCPCASLSPPPMQAMLNPDYRQRPSADSALQHRFFDLP
ncbi:unnamed protein product [Closterium sp. Naga37s-1]|nr:unnamed protein product [Closterium sp. Naga37s-1]